MQTDSKLLTTCSAQTIIPAMYSSGVQTDEPVVPDLSSSESQTDQAIILAEEAQTDITLGVWHLKYLSIILSTGCLLLLSTEMY